MKKYIAFFLLLFSIPAVSEKPKNIILIIADGLGHSQAYMSYTLTKGESQLMRCTHTGISITYSASDYITDSGAGGTAIACGTKTFNHGIGVNADSVAVKSILEIAAEKGKATGVAVTSTVTHATPASFLAHHHDRHEEEVLAAQISDSPVNFFAGGGQAYFNDRDDNRDLISEMEKNKDFEIVTVEELEQNHNILFDLDLNKNIGIFSAEKKPAGADKRGSILPSTAELGINRLDKSEKGFFFMIEASQIDWACHVNNEKWLTDELLDFEKTCKKALDFAEKDGNTLVIITADHETGALSLQDGDIEEGIVDTDFDSLSHSGVWVPIFAYGPGSKHFTGVMQNTDIFKKMQMLLE